MISLRTIWVGKNKTEAKSKEKMAKQIYGNTTLSSGVINLNGKLMYGYSVSIRESDYQDVTRGRTSNKIQNIKKRNQGFSVLSSKDLRMLGY